MFPQLQHCTRASPKTQPPLLPPSPALFQPPLRHPVTPRGATTMSPTPLEQSVLWLAWDCSSTSLFSTQRIRYTDTHTLEQVSSHAYSSPYKKWLVCCLSSRMPSGDAISLFTANSKILLHFLSLLWRFCQYFGLKMEIFWPLVKVLLVHDK